MLSSSKVTDRALTKVFIPGPFDVISVVFDDLNQLALGFRVNPVLHDMDMNGLTRVAFIREEKEPEPLMAEDDWHVKMLSQLLRQLLRLDVRVPLEHGKTLVARHAGHFHGPQALLEQTRRGLA